MYANVRVKIRMKRDHLMGIQIFFVTLDKPHFTALIGTNFKYQIYRQADRQEQFLIDS